MEPEALELLGTGHETLHMMRKGVGDGQGLTQRSYYLICNSVPRDGLYSSRWVKIT